MNRKATESNKVLPADAALALRKLMTLTRGLIDFAEKEERAITLGDVVQLSSLQDEKEKLAVGYAQASAEFRDRIEDFRSMDRRMIGDLEKLQNVLGEKTLHNNGLIEQLRRRSMANTQATLVAAQELGRPVRFNNERQREQRESI